MTLQLIRLDIYAGSKFTWTRGLQDEAGEPLTSTAGWTGECQIRSGYGGALVAGFGADHDGDLTLDAEGNVTLTLSSEATTIAAGTSTRRCVGDLEVWQTSAPDARFRVCDFVAFIYREATV